MSNFEVSLSFFLELAVILLACRLVGRLARCLGQSQVVGEMVAGVLLGPSLLGLLAPEVHTWLFPKPALAVLYCTAQLGLALYMFLVGLDFDVDLIRRRVRHAVAVSCAGIVVPFALGAALVGYYGDAAALFGSSVRGWEAMLFLGAAMSITAFPMLARIIHENGLTGTALGTLTLAAGSLDDAAAWCLFALVLATFGGQPWIAVLAVGGGLLYVAGMLTVARPLLASAAARILRAEAFAEFGFPGVLILVALAAFAADAMGIHAVFGTFVLGVVMPRGVFRERLREGLKPLTTHLLVPLFFAYSGLNTRLGLAIGSDALPLCIVVLLCACLGKGLACYAAARATGETHSEAFAIGALMNARGLMELIILNIGLERGLITPLLFSIMVVMAITTTLAATPLFRWSRVLARRDQPSPPVAEWVHP